VLEQIIASIASGIEQCEPHEFWIGASIIIVISLVAFKRMVKWWNRSRMIQDVPTSKVRSASQGYVELTGLAKSMDGPAIVSPLSRKSCVWYRYKIEEKVKQYDSKGRSKSHWKVVKQETSEELFLLEDETGRCVIDPDDADVLATNKRVLYKRLVSPPRRYTEELITVREPLYAIGLFNTVANVSHKQQREQVSYLLREWKQDPNQLLHDFDSDRNGQLDEQEWEQARLAAQRQVKREFGHQERLEQLNILKNTEHSHQGFIISTISEQKLIQHYRWHALLSLLVFFSFGCLVVWAMNIRLGH
jgi:hypothetical protein